jgi:hypothetical protein
MNIGFRVETKGKIEQGLFDKLRKKQSIFERVATWNVQRAFTLFRKQPILTGGTQRASNAHIAFGTNKMLIRFRTASDGSYSWRYKPLLGMGTSAKYGERNWLRKGAELTRKDIINKKW